MNMNYQILAAELALPQYLPLSDQDAADILNAASIAVRRRVPIAELQARSMESGVYMALRVAVANPQVSDSLRALCQTVLDLAQARFADVDLDSSASQQMFGVLTQVGIIDMQQAAAIDALADAMVSRATQLGLGYVAPGDVFQARHGGY